MKGLWVYCFYSLLRNCPVRFSIFQPSKTTSKKLRSGSCSHTCCTVKTHRRNAHFSSCPHTRGPWLGSLPGETGRNARLTSKKLQQQCAAPSHHLGITSSLFPFLRRHRRASAHRGCRGEALCSRSQGPQGRPRSPPWCGAGQEVC